MWEAERGDGTLVALKLLTEAGRARDDLTLRFQAEAGLLRRLGGTHHLIRCEAVLASPPVIVLAHYPGSLAERIAASPLPMRVALVVARQVAEALGWLHAHGVVHRDVKPSNVLIAPDGTVCLADLGVAGQGVPARGLPKEWIEEDVGTLGYAAPEQLRDPSAAAPASDLYALGVMLFEAVTGALPWEMAPGESEPAFRRRAVLGLSPDRVSLLPAALGPILARALEPDPARRYLSVAEFLEALEKAG